MTKTDNLKMRILEIERETAAQAEAREKLRAELQTAMEDGKATEKIASDLDRITHDVEAKALALGSLDARLVEVSHEENVSERNRLRQEAEAAFRKTKGEMLKALRAAEAIGKKHLPDATTMITRLREDACTALWHAVNEDFADRYPIEVPAIVKGAPERDSDGQRLGDRSGMLTR